MLMKAHNGGGGSGESRTAHARPVRSRLRRAATIPVLGLLLSGVALVSPASADPAQTLHCGSVITHSTTLANDVGPCSGDGLTIAADHVVLDLNGHSVFGMPLNQYGTEDTQSAGILFQDATGSTVMNGEVYHFATGVLVAGGSHNHVSKMNVHDNIGPAPGTHADGIALWASNDNLIDKNLVVHNGRFSGISLLSSVANHGSDGASYNTISGNIVRDNDVPILCKKATGCNGVPQGQPSFKDDVGIRIEGPGSTHNLIEHNSITGSGTNGIEVYPACTNGYAAPKLGCAGTIPNDYNVIRDNVANDNGFGAPLSGHPGDGILLLAMGPHEVLQPYHNTVEHNTTNGNERNGIDVGSGNGAGSNGGPMGCFDEPIPCGVNYDTVVHNTSVGNRVDGIYVGDGSKYNTIGHNRLYRNGSDGIEVDLYSMSNTLAHNTALGNAKFDGADKNPGCDHNTWDHNVLKTVNQSCVMGSHSRS